MSPLCGDTRGLRRIGLRPRGGLPCRNPAEVPRPGDRRSRGRRRGRSRRVRAAPQIPSSTPASAGMPPAFGTAPPVGPEITPRPSPKPRSSCGIEFTPPSRRRSREAGNGRWHRPWSDARVRASWPGGELAPATLWNPMIPGGRAARRATGSSRARAPRAAARRDDDIAFAPVTAPAPLDRDAGAVVREADAHLHRAGRAARTEAPERDHADKDIALAQAKRADAEIAAGKIPRPAARHTVRREGPSRHEGHPDDLRGGALSEPRPGGGLPSSSAG